jgi:hypothetical protein
VCIVLTRQAGECRGHETTPAASDAILTVGAGIFLIGANTMTPWETGYIAASNAIANGTLETKLNDIGNHEGSMSEVYGGAVSCLLTCYRALLAAGFTVESDDPALDEFLKADVASQIISIKRFLSVGDGKKLSAMVGIVHGCRMFIGFKAPQPATTAPTQVQVVAMPERVTSTEVERDQDGNITAARQVARDARGMPSMPLQPLAA